MNTYRKIAPSSGTTRLRSHVKISGQGHLNAQPAKMMNDPISNPFLSGVYLYSFVSATALLLLSPCGLRIGHTPPGQDASLMAHLQN